ncbi:DNA translocase FtsK [uncultured Ruminococcus sp.]|uniref:FtsK/SpoIIIE family DNA translocase n=1 Tax=uncultured Ruminococcus sp. TaxID=165186 RepID=UPI0025EC4567|nr:DNA translocase FtsK [uncultured Ruminococcus sp.]
MATQKKTTKKKASGKSTSSKAKSTKKSQPIPESQPLLTPRIRAIILGALSLFFVILIFVQSVNLWSTVRSALFGVFGFATFLVPVFLMYMAIITDKEKQIQHFKSKVALCILIVLLIGALIYVATGTPHSEKGYLACAGELYLDIFESESYFTFGAGFIGGLLGYPMASLIGNVPTVLICILVLLAVIFGITNLSINDIAEAAASKVEQGVTYVKHKSEEKARVRREYIAEREAEEAQREMFIAGGENDKTIVSPQKKKRRGKRSGIDIPLDESTHDDNKTKLNRKLEVDCDYKADVKDASKVADEVEEPQFYKSPEKEVYGEEYEEENIQNEHNENENVSDDLMDIINRASKNFDEKNHKAETKPEPVPSYEENRHNEENSFEEELENASYSPVEIREKEEKPEYHFPPIQLLSLSENNNDKNAAEEMHNNAKKLIDTLDSFNVKASIVNICRGPSVTRYELSPAPGVKISKITNLSDDIALNLAANGVRIEAPIPGKAAVGIEVPNKVVSMVTMRELIDSDEFRRGKSKLTCVLGKDISGEIVVTDLSKLTHLLIAGTTGSGKSVCVNSILMSILYKATPDEVKLLLVDPKMVEFTKYRSIPHLLIPVVTDAKKAAGALGWAVSEMEQRYKILSEYYCKNIDAYNELIEENLKYMAENPPVENEDGELVQPVLERNGLPVPKEKMPRIVIAIDELADLMMAAPSEVEEYIARLAQKARAAGMHLLVATQRPTVNVITGLIKANIPSRIALKVSSNIDSRTILDFSGAEKLIGRGDMLFLPVGAPKPMRVQGCYASDEEIEGVTNYIKKSSSAQYNAEIEEKIKRIAAEEITQGKKGDDRGGDDIEIDSKMEDAIKCVIEAGQASTSLIQRRLKVGYARAGRMIDDMEQMGIVGPHQGSKPRDVLMTYNEWLERRNIMGSDDE